MSYNLAKNTVNVFEEGGGGGGGYTPEVVTKVLLAVKIFLKRGRGGSYQHS